MLSLQHPGWIVHSLYNLLDSMVLSEGNPHFTIYLFHHKTVVPIWNIKFAYNNVSLTTIPIHSIDTPKIVDVLCLIYDKLKPENLVNKKWTATI